MSTAASNEAIKVLLVEDNPSDVRLVQEILREVSSDRFVLFCAERFTEAIVRLTENSIDVILLDLSLPDASGLETLTRMRTASRYLPIVILTGSTDEALALQAVREGAQDYLLKNNLDSLLLKHVLRNAIERKRADQAQRENEERFRALIQHSTDIITILAADGTVLYESPSLEKVMGYRPEAIQGLNIMDVIHPDDLPSVLTGMLTLVDQPDASFSGEVRLRHADGRWRTLETTMTNLLDHPAIHGIVVNSRDVTERQRKESALLESEARFKAITEALPIAIVITNLSSGTVQYANDLYCDMVGLPRGTAGGVQARNFFNNPEDRDQFVQDINQKGSVRGRELQFTVADGSVTWLLVSATTITLDGEAAILSGLQDITLSKQLERQQALLATIVESSDDAIIAKTLAGVILSWNRGAQAMYGYRPEEVIGHSIQMLTPPERPDEIEELLKRIRQGNHVTQYETVRLTKTGKRLDISLAIAPIQTPDGIIVGAATIARDITERKRGESALRLYNHRLKILHDIDRSILTAQAPQQVAEMVAQNLTSLVQCDAIRIIAIDAHGKTLPYLAAYPPASQASQDLLWQAIENFGFPDTFRQGEALRIDDVKTHEGLWVGFEEILTSRGARSWVIVPLIAGEQLVGLLAVGSFRPSAFTSEHFEIVHEVADQLAIALHKSRLDEQIQEHARLLEARVTERTEQLGTAKERSDAILMSASDAMIVANLEGSIEQVNTAFTALFGYTLEQGRTVSLFSLLDSISAEAVRRTLDEFVKDSQAKQMELVGLRQDGTLFDVDATFSRVEDGQPMILICTIRDISERKRAEVELRQAWAKEKELNELKTRFVSMVSHDFRTPLASIQSSSDLIRHYSERMTDDKKQHHFTTINEQIKHLTGLLEDMLTITKADSVGLPFHPMLTDLSLFCRTIADEMQALAGTRQIRFTINRPGEQVSIDPDLLRRALSNLLSNAVKYSPQDGVAEFSVSIGDEQIEISVKDQGIGIPEDDQVHLFEVFHRAKNVGQISGTGLGLAIVKRSVDAHGGTISMHSDVGMGSSFTISIPIIRAGAEAKRPLS